jgi:hypothetical protein
MNYRHLVLSVLALVPSFLLPASPAKTAPSPVTDLNLASLKSIEGTWLKVPHSCKAKGFNAEPITVTRRPISSAVAAIYGIRVA